VRWCVVGVAAVVLSFSASSEVAADGRHVVIKDNDAPSPAGGVFDPRQGRWQFNPANIEVTRGEEVVFQSPPSNDHPHTATSLTRSGGPTTKTFEVGRIFDSSPGAVVADIDRIEPGEIWTLQTSGLPRGHYAYVCRLHPWMVAEITIK
jgi:plastocyanin